MKLQYIGGRMAKELKTKRIIELNIDIRDAAKKIGISSATLSRLENEKIPDVHSLAMASDWLDCEMSYFFDNVPTKKQSPKAKKP